MDARPRLTNSHRILRAALIVFVVSLVARGLCIWQAQHTPISDAKHYDYRARHILEHGAMPEGAYRTPGYPYVLAGLRAIAGDDWRAAAVMHALLGALSSALLVLLASMFLDVRGAVVAGALHAIAPPALTLIPQTLTEHLALPLTLGGLLLLACADRARAKRALWMVAGSGACFGAMLLVRPAGLFMLPALALLLARNLRTRRWTPKALGLFLAVTGLVVAPWLVRNYHQGLGLMLSSVGGSNLLIGNNDNAVSDGSMDVGVDWELLSERLGEAEADDWARERAIEWIEAHPGRYLQLSGVRLLGLVGTKPSGYSVTSLAHWTLSPRAFDAYQQRKLAPKKYRKKYRRVVRDAKVWAHAVLAWWYTILCPFILVGSVLASLRFRRFAWVLLPALAYVAALALTFSQPRFRELSDPLLFVFVGALLTDLVFGTKHLGDALSRRVKLALTLVLTALCVLLQIYGVFDDWSELEPMATSKEAAP